jgi:hypothetical protein
MKIQYFLRDYGQKKVLTHKEQLTTNVIDYDL